MLPNSLLNSLPDSLPNSLPNFCLNWLRRFLAGHSTFLPPSTHISEPVCTYPVRIFVKYELMYLNVYEKKYVQIRTRYVPLYVQDTFVHVCDTDMSVSYTDISVSYTDISVSHTYRKYWTVFACIWTYSGTVFACIWTYYAALLACARLPSGAWSLHVRLGAGSTRCRCGKFVARAARMQANNEQIYSDQVRSTGQLQPQATWTAATLLRVEVPWRCWLPVVYLETTETISMSKTIIPVDRFDGHCWESDLGFLDPPTYRNPSTENQLKRLRQCWNNLKMAFDKHRTMWRFEKHRMMWNAHM